MSQVIFCWENTFFAVPQVKTQVSSYNNMKTVKDMKFLCCVKLQS